MPIPWQTLDIGNVGKIGSAAYSKGKYTVKGAGSAIGGTADSLRYVRQVSSGDCEIKLNVVSLTGAASAGKAGVMIRESLSSDAREAGVWVTPGSGIIFTRRTSTSGSTSITVLAGKKAPYWVRLTRMGDSFKAYYGTGGKNWTQFGATTTISISTNAYLGLGVCCGSTNMLATTVMDYVTAVP